MNFTLLIGLNTWFKRCLLGLATLTFCRILFIIIQFNYFKNNDLSQIPQVLFYGILFDLQAIVYCLIPFNFFSLFPYKIKSNKFTDIFLKITFVIGISFILILNLIDFEFFKIKNRRSGIELFHLINDPSNPISSYLLSYWYLVILLFGFVIILIKYYPNNKNTNNTNYQFNKLKTFAFKMALFLFVSVILVIAARGGLQTKPLRSFDAARFVHPSWTNATINSFTQLLTSYNAPTPKEISLFSNQELLNNIKPFKNNSKSIQLNIKPNIVLIILESIGRDYCGFLNNKPRFTPFLDSLSKQSLIFEHAYSSGYSSIESIPAIFASIPSLLEVPYINSNFQSNQVKGVHHYLSQSDYDCSFYYGAENGSMGFQNFLKSSGKISYFGKNEYPNKQDNDGSWGIWDEEYLNYFANELGNKQEPFFSSVFTLTSHDPYKIPEKYKSKFKGGELPIHRAVEYTDYALKQFFENAKNKEWFKNTVFIITADHTSYSKDEYFYSPMGKFEIPLLIYSPKLIKPKINQEKTVSHLDIFPSIIDLAQINDSFCAIGKSIFEAENSTAINHEMDYFQIIQYPYCLQILPNNQTNFFMQTKSMKNNMAKIEMNEDELVLKEKLRKELLSKQQFFINQILKNHYYY
jgi:phosphoglycerol transferase MdoB-like AlkP superfamily enzyme